MRDVLLYVYQSYSPDLLLTAQNVIAQGSRAFLMVDEQQMGYSEDKASLYASYLEKMHALADDNLRRLLALVNLADSAVFVVSAQGMAPVHTTVYLNTMLNNAKLQPWKTSGGQSRLDEPKNKAWALASGGSAYIYINLQGRDWPGVVAPEEYAEVQQQIITALEEMRDDTGQPLFARLVKQEDLGILRLDAANAGDILVLAAPGYSLSDELGSKQVLTQAPCCAESGFTANAPEMRAIFVAAGDGLASGKLVPAVHVTDIASTIARLLEFQPASTVEGNAIDSIWR